MPIVLIPSLFEQRTPLPMPNSMILGILQFDLHIHDAMSLKDKRKVVLSVKDRLHREHMVAVAEVAHQETRNLARMGLAMVGSDGRHVGQTLDRIVAKLRQLTDAELGDVSRQVVEASQIDDEFDDEIDDEEDEDDAATALLAAELLARAESLIEQPQDAEERQNVDAASGRSAQPAASSPSDAQRLPQPATATTTFVSPRRHSPHHRA